MENKTENQIRVEQLRIRNKKLQLFAWIGLICTPSSIILALLAGGGLLSLSLILLFISLLAVIKLSILEIKPPYDAD